MVTQVYTDTAGSLYKVEIVLYTCTKIVPPALNICPFSIRLEIILSKKAALIKSMRGLQISVETL